MRDAEDFTKVIAWLKEDWGVTIQETQYSSLAQFLKEQTTETSTFEDYQRQVRSNNAARSALLDAATIGETYFFRDEAQFRLLRDRVLPRFRSLETRMPRIWSAACSSGEEPLSLLFLLAQVWGVDLARCADQVWASDINPLALERFTSGFYRPHSLRSDGASFHGMLNPFLERESQGFLRMSAPVVKLISKRIINLVTDPLTVLPGRFDLIVLRNMMIYVHLDERPLIYRKVVEKLNPGGVLLLGKAELPFFSDETMELAEIDAVFILVKKPARHSWEKVGTA